MKKIILKNKSRSPITINLPAAIAPECARLQVVATLVSDPKTGEKQVFGSKKHVSGSVHLMGGASSEKLPESVLGVPEVQNLRKSNAIEIIVVEEN